ncbi:chemotaxis protein CheX [Malonomonas rubra DSM 5091]|uniref:Chemotaxis protein CheX n=1 Tax=Malonomonas rubra DSM 5091 TaxID=1122189 RepID=A0A1M6FLT3_MALRU|nr:chemotaxis protein CheX [Malonomonas rubra]SHI98613.1 chemotaxis protein CheX [Malonomonas rubra DSM 5091]
MGLEQTIIDATKDIFVNMIMMGATPGTPYQGKGEALIDSVTGMINLAGSHSGLLAIHLPTQAALEVSGSFLDLEIEELDDDVLDSIGELANMLAGNIKAELDPTGSSIQLSIPTTMHGDQYNIERIAGTSSLCVPFYLDDGDFVIELQLT